MFNDWNAALATLSPENVAERYAKDAVLLPTVSNKVRGARSRHRAQRYRPFRAID